MLVRVWSNRFIANENANNIATLKNSLFFPKPKNFLPYNLALFFLHIYANELKRCIQKTLNTI